MSLLTLRCHVVSAAAVLGILAGCRGSQNPAALPAARSNAPAIATRTPIDHVVFIIQENRSFNNFFMGYPGALTQNYGYDEKRHKIPLHAQDLGTLWDIDHNAPAFFSACNGSGKLPGTDCRMDGWNEEIANPGAPKDFAYAYVPRDQIEQYWNIAQQYVLADHMFASNLDGSFVAHQYTVAAYASRAVNDPWSLWGCEGSSSDTENTLTEQRTYGPDIFPCFKNATLGIAADKAGISWRYYAGSLDSSGGLWTAYQADYGVYYGPDWKTDVINPPAKFLTDIAKGKLARITWITPLWPQSDHTGLDATGGPAWIASLVNAIGTSPFWKTTAIFIMWDDWGGWFDPVQPVYEDYDGLGFRVPLIVVSPYTKRGSVTHVQYETASVLRFIEDDFGLPHLAAADRRANDPADDPAVFDFNQSPRAFKKIAGGKSAEYWLLQARALRHRAMPKTIIGDD